MFFRELIATSHCETHRETYEIILNLREKIVRCYIVRIAVMFLLWISRTLDFVPSLTYIICQPTVWQIRYLCSYLLINILNVLIIYSWIPIMWGNNAPDVTLVKWLLTFINNLSYGLVWVTYFPLWSISYG